MAAEASGSDLVQVVALLTAGVVAVPVFRRMGLGSILGYLAAGLVIGPFGLRLFSEAETILHVAELGVVMFLFIIGLEMQPSRLWGLRREIFGLGALQVGVCALLLTGVGIVTGFPVSQSFVAGAGFVMTSTAIVMQILEERGETSTPKGQRMVSILLFEDLSIVPLLALVAFLAPGGDQMSIATRLVEVAIGVGAIVGLVVGRALPAQPAVSGPRRFACPRGDDGGRASGGAGLRAHHAARRTFDGDGRFPRRRASVGIDVPASARSRRRAVSRHPARAVLHGGRHVARPVGRRRQLADRCHSTSSPTW